MYYEKIVEIISRQIKIDENKIKLNSKFKDDLGTDSLSFFEIIIAVEEEFNIKISNEQAENMVNVGDLVKYVENHLSQD